MLQDPTPEHTDEGWDPVDQKDCICAPWDDRLHSGGPSVDRTQCQRGKQVETLSIYIIYIYLYSFKAFQSNAT